MQMTDVTEMTRAVPKVIDSKTHAVLDYMTAGTFLAAGFALWNRHPRAAGLAFANGAAVLGLSMLTDYPGGIWRTLSFRTHGSIDMLQAGMSAFGPMLLGFARDPEAQFFHGQAVVESAVVAATDWNNTEARAQAAA
jgi:hypothetical protein